MRWELSDEQELYATSLREWLAARAGADQVKTWLNNGDQQTLDDALHEEGWGGVGFDEEHGGQGGGLLELALAARELGRIAAPSSRWHARAVCAEALGATPAILKAALVNAELAVLAVRADRIPAVGPAQYRDGQVTGTVPCVLAGADAHRFVVPVQSSGGSVLALIERDADGVRVHPRALLDRSRSAADVSFEGSQARILDGVAADVVLDDVANRTATLAAADSLGAAERMLEMTVEYTKQRTQFGKPIAAFQAVKHAVAQMLVTVESTLSVAFFAAASVQAGGADALLHAAAAKAQSTGHCAELADSALTVHGAIGFTWEYDLQLFYKRAKLNRVLFGTPEAWNERIAAAIPLVS